MKSIKRIFLSVLIILMIALGIYMFIQKNQSTAPVIEDSTKEAKGYVKNSKAVIYFSTPLDVENRESYAFFISNDNQATALKMDGLEFGSIAYSAEAKTILLEDENNLKFVSDQGVRAQTFNNPEYTGTDNGYLTKGQTFYSMNNTGVQDFNGPGYYSTLRYGNAEQVNHVLIDDWVQEVADNGKDTIYSLVNYSISEEKSSIFKLIQSSLTNDNTFKTTTLKELSAINKMDSAAIVDGLIYSKGHLYGLLEHSKEKENEDDHFYVDVFDFNINTKKLTLKRIPDYDDVGLDVFNSHLNTILNDNKLYTIRFDGKVDQIDINTQKVTTLYNLFDFYPSKAFEQSTLRHATIFDHKVYIIYPNEKEKHFYLDVRDLKTGKQIESNEIQGMDDFIDQSGHQFSEDLEILK